ncbi:4-alpha-glucanotransferase [Actinomadura rupiterrae]|uniref:4-alpha-glucanotransferase n=1 Tax=Actinomadura rupiterrae TaxID=559627 RepID=UPI0020A47119|nr:4-alpha-glucanotransferase [Actinomadura rupiterrae]MCP2341887.1 4-alpha-glucanotransferase [Actinomadura rupiterrae]
MKDRDLDLRALARAHGVSTDYFDWRGRPAVVSPETLRAVLTSLGADVSTSASIRDELERAATPRRLPPVVVTRPGRPLGKDGTVVLADGRVLDLPTDEELPLGWHELSVDGAEAALLVAPERLGTGPAAWGVTAQLYSVRSRASWGMGDLRDLADLAAWGGRQGAGFVLINPLHATEPVPPVGPSPYSPMSRRFASPLYLRVEDVPEYASLAADERDRVDRLSAPLRARNATLDALDRDAVWTAKLEALEILYNARAHEPDEFRAREGAPLTAFATWCALCEEQGPDWREWPAELRDAEGPAMRAAAYRLADRVNFHAWLQWQLDRQLGAAQAAARGAGMPVGIVHDLAVGVHPAGADAWMYRPLFAPGMSVGAPPDEFNQLGQDWGQPPWHPGRLAEAAYLPFRGMVAAALRHGGGLRLDHAMQVSRLWWVPDGASPADGAYVAADRDAMLSALTWEAARTGGVVVGEDLGTVEPGLREDLAARGVYGTSLLWFERDGNGRPKPPGEWRELSLATVGTHDMPPITGMLHGDHIDLRDRLGLLTRPRAVEDAEHRRDLGEWLDLLAAEGLLATPPATVLAALDDGSTAHDAEVVQALHAFLRRTPARLAGLALTDLVGERRTQNQPGTTDEYPNWRVPLADAATHPVLLDDLGPLRPPRP